MLNNLKNILIGIYSAIIVVAMLVIAYGLHLSKQLAAAQ